MNINYGFGKIVDGGGIEYPPIVYIEGERQTMPSEEDYNRRGYYRIVNNPQPEHGEDEIVVGGHYVYADEDGKRVIKTEWHIVAKPVDPKDYDAVMEEHLRTERYERGYTDREPTVYRDSTVLRWRQDAADWSFHLDQVMQYGLSVINEYRRTGQAPTLAEFKDGLPKITWTEA